MSTLQTIKSMLKDKLASQQRNYTIYCAVEKALMPFEGKKITKRLATAVEKALPEHTVYYSTDYGMYHINVWKAHLDNKISFLLGYHGAYTAESSKPFRMGSAEESHSGFKYYSASNGHWEQIRIKQNAALLANTVKLKKMARIVDNIAKAQAAFEALNASGQFCIFYDMAKKFNINRG